MDDTSNKIKTPTSRVTRCHLNPPVPPVDPRPYSWLREKVSGHTAFLPRKSWPLQFQQDLHGHPSANTTEFIGSNLPEHSGLEVHKCNDVHVTITYITFLPQCPYYKDSLTDVRNYTCHSARSQPHSYLSMS